MADDKIAALSLAARKAIAARNGTVLRNSFVQILAIDSQNAEGLFLKGIFHAGQGDRLAAMKAFRACVNTKKGRYDAAVELAELLRGERQNGEAADLLAEFEKAMQGSPYYLNYAGEIYTKMELHDAAGPMFDRANEVQPGAGPIESNLAASAAKRGLYDTARHYYRKCLQDNPTHQRYHYELARLSKAVDDGHVLEMQSIIQQNTLPDAHIIFLYFAIAKELEDLECWAEAFEYLELGNAAAAKGAVAAGYDVQSDIEVLKAIKHASSAQAIRTIQTPSQGAKPIFILGLPRTGTTLVERILSSHSQVETAGESFFLEQAIKKMAGVKLNQDLSADDIARVMSADVSSIADEYKNSIAYRFKEAPYFIEKLPMNFQYIGFIIKAFPDAQIVILDRKPVDACFAMFKQPYFRYSYRLEWLAEYYIAFHALRKHWGEVAGNQITSLSYEDLVFDTEAETKTLLESLGLEFEVSCLNFHLAKTASATASFAQIRQKAHTESVNKWLHWKVQLLPLTDTLSRAGIDTAPYHATDNLT